MIHIIDYGLGNIQAFITMYKRLGVATTRAQSASDLRGAKKLILPGVGAFDYALQRLNDSGMREDIQTLVQEESVPILGICVGMQLLADRSDEGTLPGLGWVPGKVRSFSSNEGSKALPMPHMGWNDVVPKKAVGLFKGFGSDARFYFLHSYYYDCLGNANVAATSQYGFEFHSSVERGNIYGVQFHPEKSHHWGAMLLKNFSDL
tara:strand:+ start:4005 stop:4619 length:615 start_codon:yes stop_codon:yes gene_type:complete